MNKSFCVFIISHGRADNVITKRTLTKCGYTGPLFIVVDNEDKQVDKYRQNFGPSNVIVFDKLKYALMVDNCDNFQNRRSTTHARNACFDLAKVRGFEYFLVLDDDYYSIGFTFDRNGKYIDESAYSLDRVFYSFCKMLEVDSRIATLCMLQGGDMVAGGKTTEFVKGRYPFDKRKAMNSFFCKTSRRFWFFSRLNEDVNTYLLLGSRGLLFLSIPDIHLHQKITQSANGGMSDSYLASGTYVKSFYTVMQAPSFAIIQSSRSMSRLHHKISWNNAVPKILSEIHKKP